MKYTGQFIWNCYYGKTTGISKPAFYKILKSLTEQGFLEKTEHGGLYGKASKYKMMEGWKVPNKGLQNKNQNIDQPGDGMGAVVN